MLLQTNKIIRKYFHRAKQLIVSNIHIQPEVCYFHKRKYYREMPPPAIAHIRRVDSDDKFNLIFSLSNEKAKIVKIIQFERSLQEPIEQLIQRISIKVNDLDKKRKLKKKYQTSDGLVKSEIPVQFLRDGCPIAGEIICSDLFQEQENQELSLKVGDNTFNVFINHPWVQHICLPKVLLAGYPVYPYKLELGYTNEDQCDYVWHKQSTKDWRETSDCIHSGYMFIPKSQDIGSYLKLVCTPKRGNIVGELVETISNVVVEAGPGQCFSDMRHSFTTNSLTGESFRVVTYNILAELYASSVTGRNELFTYCPKYARDGHYRKLLLLKELLGYNADILCLQEVDCSLFKRDLKSVLKTVGFEGVMAKKGGEVNEGVACFYKSSRFKLVNDYSLLLMGEKSRNEPYLQNIWKKISSKESLNNLLKNLNTTIQMLVFEYVEKPKHKLIVANTHLYFRPDADVIRMLQAGMCLNLLSHVKNIIETQEPDCTVSAIFCGDLNSTPECGVFHLFTKNHVPEDYYEWKNAPDELKVEGLSLHNPIKFDSACGTPEFTNFTVAFEGCLDYIFYNTDFLEVDQILPFPSREEISEHVAIPSVVFPSDHISLVADIKWKK